MLNVLAPGFFRRRSGGAPPPPAFDPASLFGANTGRLYDYKTSATFTDAGVTPANIGDTIYRISDRSGGANHSDQVNANARVIRRATGFEADGIDDFIPTGWTIPATDFTIVMAQVIDAALAADPVFFGIRNGTSRLLMQCLGTLNAGKLRRVFGASIVDPAGAVDQRGVYKSFAVTRAIATNDKLTYQDAVQIDSRLGVADGLGSAAANWAAESNAGTAASFTKGVYRGLLIIDRILTGTELTDLHTYWSS